MKKIIDSFLHFISKFIQPVSQVRMKGSVKMSALVTGIKGKIGGSVFQGVKGSNVIRTKQNNKPSQSGLTYSSANAAFTWSGCMAQELDIKGYLMPDGSYIPQLKTANAKQNLKVVSKAWQQLLESDRQAWQALTSSFPAKNKFGETYTPSGFSLYTRINTSLINAGLSPVARPSCHWVSIIEEQEEMRCFVCGDQVFYCYYVVNDDTDFEHSAERLGIIQPKFNLEGDNGYFVIFASRPFSKGRNTAANVKLVSVIKRVNTYKNFLLNPMLNRFYGRNIYGQNLTITRNLINAGGALTDIDSNTFELIEPVAGALIRYTLKADTFSWLSGTQTLAFGNCSTHTYITKTILIFAAMLPVKSAYSITLSQGIESNFSIIYGNPADALDPANMLTDKYGNILPIPLAITFTPITTGAKTASISVICGYETLNIDLTGTGT